MQIGVENGFGKSGKQRIEDEASKNKPGNITPGFVVERRVEKRNALDELQSNSYNGTKNLTGLFAIFNARRTFGNSALPKLALFSRPISRA